MKKMNHLFLTLLSLGLALVLCACVTAGGVTGEGHLVSPETVMEVSSEVQEAVSEDAASDETVTSEPAPEEETVTVEETETEPEEPAEETPDKPTHPRDTAHLLTKTEVRPFLDALTAEDIDQIDVTFYAGCDSEMQIFTTQERDTIDLMFDFFTSMELSGPVHVEPYDATPIGCSAQTVYIYTDDGVYNLGAYVYSSTWITDNREDGFTGYLSCYFNGETYAEGEAPIRRYHVDNYEAVNPQFLTIWNMICPG